MPLLHSFLHALHGLLHAYARERNLQVFTVVYALILIGAGFIGLLTWEWLALILAGGLFLAVELLNTAIERLSDVLDHERKLLGRAEYHAGMKWTKDVAASASLVSLVIVIVVMVIVFWPYGELLIGW
jgi:diacylglycerol kinase (ATP)